MKKCMVCKSENLYIDFYNKMYQVVCSNCQTSTNKMYESKDEAITEWNEMCKYFVSRETSKGK